MGPSLVILEHYSYHRLLRCSFLPPFLLSHSVFLQLSFESVTAALSVIDLKSLSVPSCHLFSLYSLEPHRSGGVFAPELRSLFSCQFFFCITHSTFSFHESLSLFSQFSHHSFCFSQPLQSSTTPLSILHTYKHTRSFLSVIFHCGLMQGTWRKAQPHLCVCVCVRGSCIFCPVGFSELLTFSFQMMRDRCSGITLSFFLPSCSASFIPFLPLSSLFLSIPEVSQVSVTKSSLVLIQRRHFSPLFSVFLIFPESHKSF